MKKPNFPVVVLVALAAICSLGSWYAHAANTHMEGSILVPEFVDDSGNTAGNRTVNATSGISKIAAGAGAVTITNSRVLSGTSLVLPVLMTTDVTCVAIKSVIPTGGSFTLNVSANCTGDTKVGWLVINK